MCLVQWYLFCITLKIWQLNIVLRINKLLKQPIVSKGKLHIAYFFVLFLVSTHTNFIWIIRGIIKDRAVLCNASNKSSERVFHLSRQGWLNRSLQPLIWIKLTVWIYKYRWKLFWEFDMIKLKIIINHQVNIVLKLLS